MRGRWIVVPVAAAAMIGGGLLGAGVLAGDASTAGAEDGRKFPTWEGVAARIGPRDEAVGLVGEDLGRGLGLEPSTLPTDACPGLLAEFRDQIGFCLIPVEPTLSFIEEMILAARIQGHAMTDEEIAKLIENLGTPGPDTVAEVGPLLP